MKKRPVLVWVISIFYIISALGAVISLLLIFGGAIPLNAEQKAALSKVTMFDYSYPVILAVVNLTGGVCLLFLRKAAFYFLAGVFVLKTATMFWTAVSAGRDVTAAGAGLAGALIGVIIAGVVSVYAWRLVKKGVLT